MRTVGSTTPEAGKPENLIQHKIQILAIQLTKILTKF